MIVILEGPDGAGKTTLAHELCERYQLEYRHDGPPTATSPHPLELYGAILQADRGQRVVWDRFAMGERVYGPILRDGDRFGDDGWRILNRLFSAAGATQVLCLPSYDMCHAAWSSGRDELFTDETIFKRTYDRYVQLYDPKTMFRYDHQNPVARIDLYGLLELADEMRAELPLHVIGSPVARYLFVGDRGSNPEALSPDLAFFSTNGCSRYLTRALDIAGFKETEVAFMNCYNHALQNFMNVPTGMKVIALGNIARQICHIQGVEHGFAPHPQYWRRFHYNDVESYAELLKRHR